MVCVLPPVQLLSEDHSYDNILAVGSGVRGKSWKGGGGSGGGGIQQGPWGQPGALH